MKKAFSLVLLLAVILAPVNAFADSYSDETSEKLQGGLTNTLLGWTKLFSVPHQYQNANKNPWAGAGKGATDAVYCTVAGAFNLVTFPIPGGMDLQEGCVDLSGGTSQSQAVAAAPFDGEESANVPATVK